MKKIRYIVILLFIALQLHSQTTIVNKLVAKGFVKKNDVTRFLVQDTITKEVGFVLKSSITNRANQTGQQNISTVTGLQDSISDVNNRIDVLENIQGLKTNFTGQAYAIWSGSGLVYDVIYPNYYIEGVLYPGGTVQITLNASDPTNPRQDIIAVDVTGAIKITGDPSPDPAVPSIDTQTQIYISTVLIAAGATVPSGVVQDVIYKENIEWTTSSDIATINFDATSSPYEGVKHIETDAFLAGKVIWFEDNTTHSIIDFDVVRLRIYLKGVFNNNTKFIFYFFNGNNATSNIFVLNSGQYGFDRNLINQYQDIIVPLSKFSFVGTSYDKFEVILTGGNASGFKIDNVLLDKGIGIIDPLQNAITSIVTNNGVVNSTNPDDTIAILGGDGNTVTSTGKTITVTSTVDLPFVKLNEGNGIGYVVKGRDPLNYGNVGLRAVDLSSSTVVSAVNGATGTDSFAIGDRTRASGNRSFVSGQTNVVTGNDSASFGSDNTTAGGNSATFGYGQSEAGYGNLLTGNGHLVTGGAYATVVGQFANSITNNIGNVNDGNNTMFAVGNGTATGGGTLLARSTAFQVYRGGQIIAPTLTTAIIDAEATGKVLVTKEWVTANAGGGGGTTETASNGLTKTINDIQLGGTLTANTTINNTDKILTFQGNGASGQIINITGTNATQGIFVSTQGGAGIFSDSNTGNAFEGVSTTGIAAHMTADNNHAGRFNSYFSGSSNQLFPTLKLVTGTASPQNGFGTSISFDSASSAGNIEMGFIGMRFSDYLLATAKADFDIYLTSSGTLNRRFRLASTGKLTLGGYGAGTHTGTPTYALNTDSSGNIIEVALGGGGGTTETASNGLTKTGNDIQLGGALTANTNIITGATTSNYSLSLSSTSTETINNDKLFNISASGTNTASNVVSTLGHFSNTRTGTNSTNYGVWGISSSGQQSIGVRGDGSTTGVRGVSDGTYGTGVFGEVSGSNASAVTGQAQSTGIGVKGATIEGQAFYGSINSASTNTVKEIMTLDRGTGGATSGNGIGQSIVFNTYTHSSPNYYKANEIISKWTDAASSTRTSEFSITGVNNTVTSTLLTIAGNGNTTINGTVKAKAYTVATLPTGVQGAMAYVTDATAPTYLGTLTGGGSVVCPVFYNGTAWVSH